MKSLPRWLICSFLQRHSPTHSSYQRATTDSTNKTYRSPQQARCGFYPHRASNPPISFRFTQTQGERIHSSSSHAQHPFCALLKHTQKKDNEDLFSRQTRPRYANIPSQPKPSRLLEPSPVQPERRSNPNRKKKRRK